MPLRSFHVRSEQPALRVPHDQSHGHGILLCKGQPEVRILGNRNAAFDCDEARGADVDYHVERFDRERVQRLALQ